jgi:hypothetical protein
MITYAKCTHSKRKGKTDAIVKLLWKAELKLLVRLLY